MNLHAMSQKEAATLLDRTARWLRDASAPRNDDGSYDGRALVRWMLEREAAARPRGLDAERERLARAKADKAELDLAERNGGLVARDVVQALHSESIHRARKRLLAVPDKLAAQLTNIPEPETIHNALESEIHAALYELARVPPPEAA